ncbi:flavin reductase family protein [Deinococcus sp. KSM4-11]|uniref:flavin reductase family protein n=1 Tax=Deinococcus sp. KSM4-11 TaxID=2568654 RepID=UPI0010A4D709|nr:flavin reductase family protein [Deinococcus sp. KSM4-11]THF87727.1 flavin reductase family protein [Deinococcus sp. KSM4-11]
MTTEPAFTHFDLTTLPQGARYKLVTGIVVPRPIAWVSTLDSAGHVNLAPFSFFNVMGSDPPIVAFAPGDHAEGRPKDTARNIPPGADFTVNLVSRELADAMNATATDFPAHLGEPGVLGIALEAGVRVSTPRVALSPAALECREVQTIVIGRTRILLGEVLGVTIRTEAVLDAGKQYLDTASLDLIGRMGGRGGYATTRDAFTIDRVSYEQWRAAQEQARSAQD